MYSKLRLALPFIFQSIFVFGLVLATVLLLIPSYKIPNAIDFYDKAQHLLLFAVLTIAGLLAHSQKVKNVCLGLCFYGGLMEVLQTTMTTTRHGDWMDWLADSAGILVGLGLYLLIRRLSNNIAINKIAI